MKAERRTTVDHTTVLRWIQHFAPPINKRVYWQQRYAGAA
jgi:transposase-like protein